MRVKDLVKTCGMKINKIVVHSNDGWKFEGEWDSPYAINHFDMWEKSVREVQSWKIERKALYIIIK